MAANSSDSPKSLVVSIHNYPYNKSINTDDDFDCVKVEISDLDNSCPNPTTLSLMKCKKEILHPFRKLLCLIGWRPFGVDSLKRSSIFLRLINIIYPILILMLLLFNYTYEIIICQGKLNVITDTQTSTTVRTTTKTDIITTGVTRNHSAGTWATLQPGKTRPHTTPLMNVTMALIHNHAECGHIFTTYILPDIFHFVAFIIGFIYFRVTEGEPMYSLMEKVFIHADHQNIRLFGINRAIRRLKLFMLLGSVWVLVSVATHALSNAMNDFAHTLIFHDAQFHVVQNKPERYIFFTIDIICLLISNCIHMAVVMNYACHCEMILFYCKAIRIRLEEKSINLLEAMKRILDLGVSISQLNSAASRMMSILIIFFIERTILGFILLVMNRIFQADMWIYRSLYTLVWFSILAFCLGQAARVTSKCDKFYRISLSMRVYGYPNATSSELDGFLLFLSKAGLRVKLFGLTVRPGKIIFIGITTLLVFIVLFQTSIISSENFFF
ncbi:unnamed protein product [Adineta steineri]|uniref:Gustatory receptor n=2 Tax=Adineta steineri TaxID=433720 RepID=A0A813RQS2_9BILA|nr:unnamed protein product [Adineta steineri]CAF0785459.1 unnamed protein product [Adineta steineri]CAF0804383.1 unnamed protein product [Adineta steineri]CAF0808322.1 unnamed protein product [Adineta steineri]CAF0815807.1 unnamed protein product [Adineta steineri]